MRKRILAGLLCATILAALLTACGKTSSVTLPISAAVTSLDPQISSGDDTRSILNNCFEGLVRIDENGEVQPGAADHWTVSDDGLTYTFTLRSDGTWHLPASVSSCKSLLGDDYKTTFNTKVTASDFVFGFRRAVDPNTQSPGATSLFNIRNAEDIYKGNKTTSSLGVTAESDTTLVIQLGDPNVNFLTVLAQPVAMPCNETFFNATIGRYGLSASLLLSNGPYYVSGISSGGTVSLSKNDTYKGNCEASTDSASFVVATDTSSSTSSDTAAASTASTTEASDDTTSSGVDTMTSLLSDSGLDAAAVKASSVSSLPKKYDVKTYASSVKSLCFNMKSSFFKHYDLRMSILYATDPDTLSGVGSGKAGGILPACTESVSGTNYRKQAGSVTMPGFSLTKAKSSYAAYSSDASSYSITLVCLEDDRNGVQAMVQNWQKVYGTSLSVVISTYQTQADLDAALSSGDFDAAFTSLSVSDFIAPNALQRFLSSNADNVFGIDDDTLDTYIYRAGSATDEQTVTSSCLAAENRLISQGYVLPLRADNSYVAFRGSVKGVSLSPAGNTWALYTLNA